MKKAKKKHFLILLMKQPVLIDLRNIYRPDDMARRRGSEPPGGGQVALEVLDDGREGDRDER